MPSRQASHAGSWYSGNGQTLTRQLDNWLAQVPKSLDEVGSLPVPGARVIIAPYVQRSQIKDNDNLTEGTFRADETDMRVMPTQDHVRPLHTRLSICPRREFTHRALYSIRPFCVSYRDLNLESAFLSWAHRTIIHCPR